MEQHHSECSLEPVACEMKEFGCSVVVPRKELARHMRESELQHLTTMTHAQPPSHQTTAARVHRERQED